MLARRIEQRIQERRGAGHLRLDIERLEAEDDRRAMLADARAHRRNLAFIIVAAVDHDMGIGIGERHEIALGIDHDLLHQRGAFLEDAAQQVRLARPRIALDEQARREQFLHVDAHALPRTVGPDVDAGLHAGRPIGALGQRQPREVRTGGFCRAILPSRAKAPKRAAWISTTSSAAISAPPTSRRSTPRRTPRAPNACASTSASKPTPAAASRCGR